MIQLHENSIYLVDGRPEEKASIPQNEARKQTMAWQILQAHNTSGDPERLKIRFDAMVSHDITYVGILQQARASGMNVKAMRIVTVLCATGITASCVSMCGQVGWVGLLVPHLCRMRYGSNHLALVPSSVCVGAAFMVAVDTMARSVSAAELPLSILTAIIGAPFFIVLMRRSGGWQM